MTYETTNPPRLMVPSVGGGPQIWAYEDGDDDGTVNGGGYFTNGVTLGMRVGDMVWHYETTLGKGSLLVVASVSGDAATTAFALVA